MKLLDITYNNLSFSNIVNTADFFKSGPSSEMISVKTLYNNIKILFGLNSERVIISLSEANRVYKFTLSLPNDIKKIFGFIVYIPSQRRIDIYTSENVQVPLIQYKGKKIMYKSYPYLLDKAGLDKLFTKLITVL